MATDTKIIVTLFQQWLENIENMTAQQEVYCALYVTRLHGVDAVSHERQSSSDDLAKQSEGVTDDVKPS